MGKGGRGEKKQTIIIIIIIPVYVEELLLVNILLTLLSASLSHFILCSITLIFN